MNSNEPTAPTGSSPPSAMSPIAMTALLVVAALAGLAPAVQAQNSASATIEDQTAGGTTVHVASATLPDGGFVAVHDGSLQDGAVLGSVVGASTFLEAGTHEDVQVRLDEPLTEDATLIAMPHKDTNGDRIYSFVASSGSADGPYTQGGNAVVDDASVTVSATTTLEDQPTDGTSILVDRIEMAEGGFAAIHDERLLDGMPLASVVGHSDYLGPGVHHDVRVDELTRTFTDNSTLISMPHKDTDGDESYDFVTSGGSDDGPYRNADGEAVVDSATFSPSSTADATFRDQSTGGTNLVVAEAFLPEGGFVTMHDSSLAAGDTFESVRGNSECLEPGLHRSIAVQLDDPLSSDDELIAMPHKDTNDNCSYDFVTSDGSEDGAYTDEDGIVTDSGQATLSASVHYSDQESNGHTITIDSVDTVGGGFVAVHDASLLAGEVFGSVVGVSSYLEPGPHEDIEVTLDAPINTGQILIPMPHKDTDNDKKYSFVESDGSEDGPYTSGGDPIVTTGDTIVRSTVTIEDQQSTGTVTVASATLHDGGFVTIHDGSLLEGQVLESVVGISQVLDPGTHEDIEIQLDDDKSGDVTLIAMPHYDSNGNGAYDFVDSGGSDDGPYVAGGSAVVDTAAVTFPSDTGGTDGGADGGDGGERDAPAPGIAVLVGVLAGLAVLVGRRRI